MKKKVLITGSSGLIGKILVEGLKNKYDLIFADLPKIDVIDYSSLKKVAQSCFAIIHLAWNTKTENFQSIGIDKDNTLMYENVYKVSKGLKIPRVLIASSIHADNFRKKRKSLLKVSNKAEPLNPYGAHKIEMEKLGKIYSNERLQIVCIRFGAVGYSTNDMDEEGKAVWLSPKDCVSLIDKILSVKKLKKDFEIVYAVSNNKTKVHDFSNSFGWKPKDDSSYL